MTSKRFKKLPEKTTELPSEVIEKLLEDISLSSNNAWRIVNLRYFNPIGADPDGLIGESPSSGKNNIYPLILDAASQKLEQFTIFGNDWDTKDGTGVRDYIHIMDLAEAHINALNFLENNNGLNIFNKGFICFNVNKIIF